MIRGADFMIATMVLLGASYSNAHEIDGRGIMCANFNCRTDYNASTVRTMLKDDSDIKEMNEIETAGVVEKPDQMVRNLLGSDVEGQQRRAGVPPAAAKAIADQYSRSDVEKHLRRSGVSFIVARAIAEQMARSDVEDQDQDQ